MNKLRTEHRLFVGKSILSVKRATARKSATVTFEVPDEFALKAINHVMALQRFSLAMPVFLGLDFTWDEEASDVARPRTEVEEGT